MLNVSELIDGALFVMDGAMGTQLQALGLEASTPPEVWNLTRPEAVRSVHAAYAAAGCGLLKTNTFGCNPRKLARTGLDVKECMRLAVHNAKTAAPGLPVAVDIGPLGALLKPLGELDFEEAVSLFRPAMEAGAEAGGDLILLETFTDTYELKAAVLAAHECSNLPVVATVAFDRQGRLLTGADPAAVVALLEGLRVDGLGMNCGLPPEKMLPLVREMVRCSSLPVFVSPNAGIPHLDEDGKTVFDLSPEAFARGLEEIAGAGARVLGGCCGTTPEHIAAAVEHLKGITPKEVVKKRFTVVSSGVKTLEFDRAPVVVGERINPTGKPRLKRALREENLEECLKEAAEQEAEGADALDVNVGLAEIDEKEMLPRLVCALQAVTALPLQLDSANPQALERAMRLYNGKPLVNSVNASPQSMAAVFPLMAQYGGVAVALAMDEEGIPETAQGRIRLLRRIVETAEEYGIGPESFLADGLTMSVGADPKAAAVTLETVRRAREELGLHTILGVSNVSFGLPQRPMLNAAFLNMALACGLSAAIVNPHDSQMRAFCAAAKMLLGNDPGCAEYLERVKESEDKPTASAFKQAMSLREAIHKGLAQEAVTLARKALENSSAMEIIENELVPALARAGEEFGGGKMFLPQLMGCAEAARQTLGALREAMPSSEQKSGVVVLATVRGDVHDIGKNIVRALLESGGFEIIDLGKDVAAQTVVEAARESGARLVGLSALMTTTLAAMEETVALLKKELPGVKVMCGGAVLSEQAVRKMQADAYVADAFASLNYARAIYGQKE